VIKSFRHAGLENFFKTGSKAGIQPEHAKKIERQLLALNRAIQPSAMNLPGWQLPPSKGNAPATGR
jgi:proteic killer suppression protein